MTERENHWLARLTLLLTILLTGAALAAALKTGAGSGTLLGRFSSTWAGVLLGQLLLIGAALALLELSFTPFAAAARQAGQGILRRLQGLGWLNLILLELLPLGILWLVFRAQPDRLYAPLLRLWLMWLAALLGGLFIQAYVRGLGYFPALLGAALMVSFLFAAAGYFVLVNDYPFSLGWSEGSRYYNASLFFAQPLYGHSLPLPVLHPTRYLLQSIPFIFPGAGIRALRAWQAGLWLVLPLLTAWLLVRRLKLNSPLNTAFAALFAFLFFYQGPVYYHLVLCAVPVLAGFDPRRPGRSLAWVLLASVWAGLSRVNWWPVPGALAVLLWMLEIPLAAGWRKANLWRYLRWPLAWGTAGVLAAFGANRLYEALSGNPPEVFNSALNSPLLWERLWPNITYGPGILLMTALTLAAPLALLAFKLLGGARWHALRLAGIGGVLLVFLAGGLVVSVKIGGGSNLHNLDALVLLLGVVLLYIGFDRFAPDVPAAHPRRFNLLQALLVALVVLIPAAQPAYVAKLPDYHDPARSADNLASLKQQVEAAGQTGEVLFLTEKQLLTFGEINIANFDPEHEKVFLMEMAMADNQAYLQKFYADLRNHRYALIVSEPLNNYLQDERSAFAEENNAWVLRVVRPVLESYQQVDKMPEDNVYLYAPRP